MCTLGFLPVCYDERIRSILTAMSWSAVRGVIREMAHGANACDTFRIDISTIDMLTSLK